jgi:hypothetical protein
MNLSNEGLTYTALAIAAGLSSLNDKGNQGRKHRARFRAKRKTRRLMAKESRRRNR